MGPLLLPCLFNLARMDFSYLTVPGAGALHLLVLVRLSFCGPIIHVGHRVLPLLGPLVQLFEPITTMDTVMWLELLEDLMGSVNALGLRSLLGPR